MNVDEFVKSRIFLCAVWLFLFLFYFFFILVFLAAQHIYGHQPATKRPPFIGHCHLQQQKLAFNASFNSLLSHSHVWNDGLIPFRKRQPIFPFPTTSSGVLPISQENVPPNYFQQVLIPKAEQCWWYWSERRRRRRGGYQIKERKIEEEEEGVEA